jgi:hypothetical protein
MLKSTTLESEFKQPEDFVQAASLLGRGPPAQDALFRAAAALRSMEAFDPEPTGKALFCVEVLTGGTHDPVALMRAGALSDLVFFPRFAEAAFEAVLANQPRHCLGFPGALSLAGWALHPCVCSGSGFWGGLVVALHAGEAD